MSATDPSPRFADLPLGVPGAPEAPIDPALLAQLANAFFAAKPGVSGLDAASLRTAGSEPPSLPAGVQAPLNPAPPGSPLVSPAGLGPSVPGTPIPQGQVPGSNLLPASPAQLPSLAHRAPALAPHAPAGNGVPDSVFAALPGYEPRFGSAATAVPLPESAGPAQAGGSHAAYYFLSDEPGRAQAASTGPANVLGATQLDDALARLPWQAVETPAVSDGPGQGVTRGPQADSSAVARYYFVEAEVGPGPGEAGPPTREARPTQHPPFDIHAIRRDFPVLQERVNGHQLVWFDNAATTHKPQSVIDRLAYFYAHENSNIHRAAHALAALATDAYEGARERVRRFINAPDVNEVIFVRGTTEAINLVAKSWGAQHVGEGDEIIVSHLEHHANIVPWQQLARAKGARLRVIPVDDSGQVLLDEYQKLLNDRTRIVSVTQVSNALGTIVPVKQIVELARRAGARTLVDGAQSVSHMRVDVQEIGADFFVFSGHKVFGPTGIGALWGRREVLEDMPPWQGGGNMIADVTFEKTVFQPIPNKFEAGTGNIADAVGLGAALDYVAQVGIENIDRYEHALLDYGMQGLSSIPGVRLIGTAAHKASVMSFVLSGYTTEEVGQALNQEGIAVRTGHHCAQPILRRFGVETTVRPSLAFYNTFDEIDRLLAVVGRLASARKHG